MYTFEKWVLIFFLYSFIGWIWECIVCSITEKKITNSGLIQGPFTPIYGFGSMLFIYYTKSFQEDFLKLFIFGFFIITILEFSVGLIIEKLFNVKLWDYSKFKFNINGRICLYASIVWGLASVLIIIYIHPFIENNIINNINEYFLIDYVLLIIYLMRVLNILKPYVICLYENTYNINK